MAGAAEGLPHASMLRGTVVADFDALRAQERGAPIIAGAFRRALEVVPSKLCADTSTRAVTVQTPSLFCDLRVGLARPTLPAGIASFDDLPVETLAALARTTHCFAGYSYLDGDNSSVCRRLHALDWQPMPRLRANLWRIQPQFAEGGWVEWSARVDEHGQSEYMEYWRTLSSSRDGPFLALRRRATADLAAAYFLVCEDHWAYISGRSPADELPVVTPGQDGHPIDRGRVEPLVAAAEASEDRTTLLAMLSMECHYGRVHGNGDAGRPICAETNLLGPSPPNPEGRRWQILLSSMPWREQSFFDVKTITQEHGYEIFQERGLVESGGARKPTTAEEAIEAVTNASNPTPGTQHAAERLGCETVGRV